VCARARTRQPPSKDEKVAEHIIHNELHSRKQHYLFYSDLTLTCQ
jgi:hypothetical protein